MLTQKIENALNDQINAEMYSSYLYLSMSAYFESLNLPGAANWMQVQAREEMVHAMKFYRFVIERGGRVKLRGIQGPPTQWASPLAVFQDTLKHEQSVTARINALVDLVRDESDHASEVFLQWFVSEQVEEEASADAVIKRLQLAADTPAGIFMIDQELATRVFVPPPGTADAGA